jgi:hypothetical protein
MKKCFDEGTLQAYLDGELSPEKQQEAEAHLAHCALCTEAIADAEQEFSLLAAAFAPDASISVPTEHLRARIRAGVAQLKSAAKEGGQARNWNFGALFGSLSGLFAPRYAAAFASLLAVVVAVALLFMLVERRNGVNPAAGDTPVASITRHEPAQASVEDASGRDTNNVTGDENIKGVDVAATGPSPTVKVRHLKAGYDRSSREFASRARKEAFVKPAERNASETLLPGEKDYRDTIASLSRTIAAGGDVFLKPSVRADYERNVAVLDRAISETRGAVLRNPKDKDAVNFLMSAYQSKVELLTTVADHAQVATLGR